MVVLVDIISWADLFINERSIPTLQSIHFYLLCGDSLCSETFFSVESVQRGELLLPLSMSIITVNLCHVL